MNALVFIIYLYLNDAHNSMELIRGIQHLPKILKKAVVTIGNFDGVHLGHQKIIQLTVKKARNRAKGLEGPSVAYTFRPHPQIMLRPDQHLQLLSTYDEKIELLQAQGLDLVIEEPFSREFSTVSPEQFFNDILLRKLNASDIVVGYDFSFGKGREGHLEVLEALCKQGGVGLTIVPPLRIENEVVSSSSIRQHLLAGQVEAAIHQLGRPFSYKGVVIKGEQRGRKLGFPTANLKLENKLALPYGVYATWAKVGTESFPSVTNVGVRPSFHSEQAEGEAELAALVETHLIGRSMDLYGTTLEVSFMKRIREERKFSGPDFINSLKTQIAEDAKQAAEILAMSKT
jgi:riboflavin kinase/FMN adenylyltransferase